MQIILKTLSDCASQFYVVQSTSENFFKLIEQVYSKWYNSKIFDFRLDLLTSYLSAFLNWKHGRVPQELT